jgi:hypothetical protein
MIIIYGYDLYTMTLPLLTPWWQQRVANVRRLLGRKGDAA